MSEPSPWAGVWIAEDIELIARGVRDGSWVDGTIGVVSAGLDGLALMSDPAGALLQYGIAWLIEHVKPLSEALDWLAGDPVAIAAQAEAWRGVAAKLGGEAEALGRAVRDEVAEWTGAAGDAYRSWASGRQQALRALGRASETMALLTEGAGALIGTVRLMVRDAVATVVSRLVVYAGEVIATGGLATPLVAEQVATLCAAWGARIARWLRGLLASLRKLIGDGERLRGLIDFLKRTLGGDAGSGGAKGPRPGDPGFDGGLHKAPLGEDFAPGVRDPDGRFKPKEAAVAERLAAEGEMVHARVRSQVEGDKSPDAMVRTGPGDGGTVTEFKTMESASSGAVSHRITDAGKQVAFAGGGDVVIDGRAVGLTEETARLGHARALGRQSAHGIAMPDRVRVILGDGTMIELP
ncbi:WXG100 family type VII secretion target [Actinoplanes sp. NPDC051470]|uniref:WXG100 family type VII secretion target n=1 Tax=Actinoplanes sp. NPDC051470 TaxID=3157224 RepID=UPI0034440B82